LSKHLLVLPLPSGLAAFPPSAGPVTHPQNNERLQQRQSVKQLLVSLMSIGQFLDTVDPHVEQSVICSTWQWLIAGQLKKLKTHLSRTVTNTAVLLVDIFCGFDAVYKLSYLRL